MYKINLSIFCFLSVLISSCEKQNEVYYEEEGKLIRKAWYESGAIKGYAAYDLDTVLDGSYLVYHENGNLRLEAVFERGNLKGTAREFYEDGSLRTEVPYRNGIKEGLVQEFYKNGQLKQQKEFEQGKMWGNWMEFYNLLDTVIYQENGKDILGVSPKISVYRFSNKMEGIAFELKYDSLGHIYDYRGKTISSYYADEFIEKGKTLNLAFQIPTPPFAKNRLLIHMVDKNGAIGELLAEEVKQFDPHTRLEIDLPVKEGKVNLSAISEITDTLSLMTFSDTIFFQVEIVD